jgi:hypothetical protein
VSRAAPRRRGDPHAGRRAARLSSRRSARWAPEEAPPPALPGEELAPAADVPAADPPRARRGIPHRLGVAIWLTILVAAAVALVAAIVGTEGPGRVTSTWLADAGAIAVSTAYTWGLAARTGGRPVVFSILTLVLGGLVVGLDSDSLRGGAAVVTAVLTAVFAVMATVPAVHVLGAVRENGVALVLAAIGSMATVAWAPVVNLDRFQYTVLGLSLVASFLTVFRLGAGWHGLGTRGVLTVIAGSVMLALTLGYAELLRRYGTESLVNQLDDAVRWSHHHLGAFPRPIVALLGVPALTWGTHMRARRRQGWWVCAFGVALTAPVAYALVDPGRTVVEATAATAYGAVIGFAIGYLLILADLRLTGPRPTGPRGRRLAETEVATAIRPEPGRTHAVW